MDKKDKDTEIKDKRCFIITPIGDLDSEIFRKAKGVIDSVIKPVLHSHGFVDIKPAYEITESGMIGNQIIDRVINDDLVVANLTGNNPNVMYELAIRHATAKPIIHICEKGTALPFDIKDNRTIFFRDDMLGVQELQKEFASYIKMLSYEHEYRDNPIYNGIQMTTLLDNINDEGRKTEAELLQIILDKLSEQSQTKGMKIIKERDNIFDDKYEFCHVYVTIDNYAIENYDNIELDLIKEMSKLGVLFMKSTRDTLFFNNQKKIDINIIKQKVSDVAKKNMAKLTCKQNIAYLEKIKEN